MTQLTISQYRWAGLSSPRAGNCHETTTHSPTYPFPRIWRTYSGQYTRMGTVPTHWQEIHEFSGYQEGDWAGDFPGCGSEQGYQQTPHIFADIQSRCLGFDARWSPWPDKGPWLCSMKPTPQIILLQIPVGDQPSDIERQIRNLVLDYISKSNRFATRLLTLYHFDDTIPASFLQCHPLMSISLTPIPWNLLVL